MLPKKYVMALWCCWLAKAAESRTNDRHTALILSSASYIMRWEWVHMAHPRTLFTFSFVIGLINEKVVLALSMIAARPQYTATTRNPKKKTRFESMNLTIKRYSLSHLCAGSITSAKNLAKHLLSIILCVAGWNHLARHGPHGQEVLLFRRDH